MTDEELMQAYVEGDLQAFQALYGRHRDRVFGYLVGRLKSRAEAEEVFQEAFVKLHGNRFRYQAGTPFMAWLFIIVKNSLIDHVRKQNTRGKYLELDPESVTAAVDEYRPAPDVGEAVAEMSRLSSEQRMMLSMRFNEGRSFAEIAESMDISQPNARKIVSRAIQKLRGLMTGKE